MAKHRIGNETIITRNEYPPIPIRSFDWSDLSPTEWPIKSSVLGWDASRNTFSIDTDTGFLIED